MSSIWDSIWHTVSISKSLLLLFHLTVYLASPLGCLRGNSGLTQPRQNSWFLPATSLLPHFPSSLVHGHHQSSSCSEKIQVSSFGSSFYLISYTQSFNTACQTPKYIQNLSTSVSFHCCHLSPSQHHLSPGSILHIYANDLLKVVFQIMSLSCLKLFNGFLLDLD